jgi:Flp pilus assembly protein TadD
MSSISSIIDPLLLNPSLHSVDLNEVYRYNNHITSVTVNSDYSNPVEDFKRAVRSMSTSASGASTNLANMAAVLASIKATAVSDTLADEELKQEDIDNLMTCLRGSI